MLHAANVCGVDVKPKESSSLGSKDTLRGCPHYESARASTPENGASRSVCGACAERPAAAERALSTAR